MSITLQTSGLPSQSPQGVGVRLVRRLGGAVRSAIVSGIALAGTLRRPAPSQTSRDGAAAQHPEAPAPRPVPGQPRSPASLPAPLLLARLLAFARRQRKSAATSRPAFLNHADTPFTPEAFPQLSPRACAVLNTPLKDCDPKTLELVVSTFAQYINQVMSPEAGITNPAATLPNLWHHISTALGDTKADTALPATPEALLATPADEVPDAPVAPPDPAAHVPATSSSAKDAPRVSPIPSSGPPAFHQPADATIPVVAPQTVPAIADRSFRNSIQSVPPWRCPRPFRPSSALFPPGAPEGLQCLPPPWRLYYAACTGPP